MICLLNGIPDVVVIDEILPRLAWDVRPICRSVSKLWKTTIDTNTQDPERTNLTRRHQIPLLTGSCIVSIIQAESPKSWLISKIWKSRDDSERRLLLLKDSHGYTRQLPPVKLFQGSSHLVFWKGIVCVWTVTHQGFYRDRDRMLKLDIGAGKWTWQSVPVQYVSAWTAILFRNGKIYATPRIATYVENDDGICFNGFEYLNLPNRRRRTFYDRILDVDYGVEVIRFSPYYQMYDMLDDGIHTSKTPNYDRLAWAKESWDCLDGPARLASFTDNYKRLETYEAGGVWKEDKAATAALEQSDWCSRISPVFLRGDSFLPPFKEGFNLVTFTAEVLTWCNTKSFSSWHTIKNLGSGLEAGVSLKSVSVKGGKLLAKGCDGNEDVIERKWFIFYGVIDSMRNVVAWEVFVELKAQELEYWDFMK